jgi:hypothetical protein
MRHVIVEISPMLGKKLQITTLAAILLMVGLHGRARRGRSCRGRRSGAGVQRGVSGAGGYGRFPTSMPWLVRSRCKDGATELRLVT